LDFSAVGIMRDSSLMFAYDKPRLLLLMEENPMFMVMPQSYLSCSSWHTSPDMSAFFTIENSIFIYIINTKRNQTHNTPMPRAIAMCIQPKVKLAG